jgi:BirA family biotin operon repressor/biotin-[acetyl-CoA-carboxylase] ligase
MNYKINHKHFKTIPSTQSYLKDNYSKLVQKTDNENILISTSSQSEGQGRYGNQWDHYNNSLAFSFSLKISTNDDFNIIPLALSVYLIEWLKLKTKINLKVKWPNDILTNSLEKCGGILCNFLKPSTIIVGIGINYGKTSFNLNPSYKTKPGIILKDSIINETEKKELPYSFYKYLLQEECKTNDKIQKWEKFCAHLNKNVRLTTGPQSSYEGIFKGLTSKGEAIIEGENLIRKTFISGSLNIS